MLSDVMESGRRLADAALERLIPPAIEAPASIHQAMRHSVFAGGKRLRPILCMEAARLIAGSLPEGVEELGAALEMLHTYSYEVLARLRCPAERRVRLIEEVAHDTGTVDGMIGGQVMDLAAEHTKP